MDRDIFLYRAKALARIGYRQTRQTGSHLRLTSLEAGEHHATVPRKRAMPVGTLRAILRDIARHRAVSLTFA
ncbi:MAG: type II toxin-antitoxin system HicA family toxin [Bryobacteraceae bacterium]